MQEGSSMNVIEKAKKKNKIAIAIITTFVILVLAFLCYVFFVNTPVDSDNKESEDVIVQQGATVSEIIDILEKDNLIRSGVGFKIIAYLTGNTEIQAGSYTLSKNMSIYEIVNTLGTGKTSDLAFTVIPGMSTEQIAKNLAEKNFVTYDDFMKEVKGGKFDYPFMSMLPSGEKRLEGFLYPDTYKIPKKSTAHQIINKMLDEFDENVYKEFSNKTVKSKYNFYDVIKIASIIEKEAGKDDERAKVSSVIYNRLEKGMTLGMCSTVEYVLKTNKKVLSNDDVAVDSPYNTYINKGLPPTPISNPDIKSIEAAFNPADTDYLFFVLSEKLDGTTNFSKDEETFEKDRTNFSNALEENNGKLKDEK